MFHRLQKAFDIVKYDKLNRRPKNIRLHGKEFRLISNLQGVFRK